MSEKPRPAPKRYSAHPAALASFSIVTGAPRRSWSASRSGSSCQAMLGAWMTVERSFEMNPAAATPTPAISRPRREMAGHVDDGIRQCPGVHGGVHAELLDDRAVGVDDASGDLRSTDVDSHREHR